MYGEDIDLSYRIVQVGYKNYYLANSSIIHFKGESTKKDILYTKLFYKAMRIFVEKYYGKEWGLFSVMMQLAIAMRGVLSFTGRLFLNRQPSQAPGFRHTRRSCLDRRKGRYGDSRANLSCRH